MKSLKFLFFATMAYSKNLRSFYGADDDRWLMNSQDDFFLKNYNNTGENLIHDDFILHDMKGHLRKKTR